MIESGLIIVLLVWGSQEELSITDSATNTHLHDSSYFWQGHVSNGFKRALLICKDTKLVSTLLTSLMTTELTGMFVISPQLFITDNALCLLTEFLFYWSFQREYFFIQLKAYLLVTHIDLVCVAHRFSWKIHVVAVLLICDREELAASIYSLRIWFNGASFN